MKIVKLAALLTTAIIIFAVALNWNSIFSHNENNPTNDSTSITDISKDELTYETLVANDSSMMEEPTPPTLETPESKGKRPIAPKKKKKRKKYYPETQLSPSPAIDAQKIPTDDGRQKMPAVDAVKRAPAIDAQKK